MSAKKTALNAKRCVSRDKEAKIGSIMDATRKLIEIRGYENVTIRDIAEAAGVSIGLIYKYYPGGKFDILMEIGSRYTDQQLMLKQPESIDFNDFPGYMRAVIKNMLQQSRENRPLVKALTLAALLNDEIADEVKKIDIEAYTAYAEFFYRFDGVDLGEKKPLDLLMCWGITLKGILLTSMIYPLPLKDDEALIDLMVDISLKIWGYQKKS